MVGFDLARTTCSVLALVAGCASAQQTYPAKSIRLVVPSATGGGTDIVARILAPKLSERFGQNVITDNRPGAGTMIGIELVAKSAPDGYTVLIAPPTLALNSAVYRKVPYDPIRDFAPVTCLVGSTSLIVAHRSLPIASFRELIEFARKRPGQLNYASAGKGTYSHMTMELLNYLAGLRMEHIPYKGTGPALIDVVAGQITVMASSILSSLPQVRAGRLRPLGITSLKRSAAAPDIPTVSESGMPGFESLQWYGALVPAQTPKEVVARLHAELIHVLALPDIKERLLADGIDPIGDSPEHFARYIRDELIKWGRVAKAAGITPE